MPSFEIRLVPALSDNYAPLLHFPETGETVLVDAPDPVPIAAALDEAGWKLTHILVTHHHPDHVQGIPALKTRFRPLVIGPAREAVKIGTLDRSVRDGEVLSIGGTPVHVIATPGHTLGHVAYHLPEPDLMFVGDTLFALGCGRLFEGTPEQMWASLARLRTLASDDTAIYCGHEYTLSNAHFACAIDPDNHALTIRAREVAEARQAGLATVPSRMGLEKATNPFLRCDVADFVDGLDLDDRSPAAVFAHVRQAKDRFR